jgi:RNA polymerase sigma-70 factor (ECF subfamily)
MNIAGDEAPLVARLRAGDAAAAGEPFERCRERLKRMVRLRLDHRLQGRLDASDVLRDAFLDVRKKVPDFGTRELPVYLWLRLIVIERLLILHRHHLGARARAADREVSLCRGQQAAARSHSLANLLLGRLTSPTRAALRAERQRQFQEALNGN